MEIESVSFDAKTGELRNVPAFFAERLPDGLRWTIQEHVAVQPGMPIGLWHWDDGSTTAIVAPEGCRGFLIDVNDRVSLNLLDTLPSQTLIELGS